MNQPETTPSTPSPSPATPPVAPAPSTPPSSHEADKGLAYLCYLGILVIIPLLLKRDSEFVKFHAKQGLVLAIAWFVGSFLYAFLGLGFIVHLATIVLSIMGLINVNKGTMKDLPLVGSLAKNFNF